jgi:hypothetical protein
LFCVCALHKLIVYRYGARGLLFHQWSGSFILLVRIPCRNGSISGIKQGRVQPPSYLQSSLSWPSHKETRFLMFVEAYHHCHQLVTAKLSPEPEPRLKINVALPVPCDREICCRDGKKNQYSRVCIERKILTRRRSQGMAFKFNFAHQIACMAT